MTNIKARLILLICIVMIFLFSGCWDYLEFENMALVSVIGIDASKDSQMVTVTTNIPSIGKSGGKKEKKEASTPEDTVQTASDLTISDALSKIQQVVGKKLFFGHTDIIVLGEDAAESITGDILEFIDRTPRIRQTTYIAVAAGKANVLISTHNINAILPLGRNLKNMINESAYTGAAYPVSIHDFLDALTVGGMDAMAPRIQNVIKGQAEKSRDADNNSEESGKIVEPVNGYQRVSGMAVFKSSRLKGFLTEQECHGLGFLAGKDIRDYKTIFESEEHTVKNAFVIQINGTKKKVKVQLNNNRPEITVNISVNASLSKYLVEKGPEYLTPDVLSNLEVKLEEGIQHDIEAALKKCQKDLNSDVFGFGYNLFSKYPREWRAAFKDKWPEIYPDVPIYISIKAKITNTGTNIKKLHVSYFHLYPRNLWHSLHYRA